MNKILYFLTIIGLLTIDILAKEPTLAILKVVNSNSQQVFSIGQSTFICKAYGVVSVEELYQKAKDGSECKKSIEKFYRQNPKDIYFSESLLHLRQTYHVEFKNKECILYAKGLNSLCELLLSNGLAIMKTTFNDEEFSSSFTDAQVDAKENNMGMHKNKIKFKCIEELLLLEKKSL